MGAFWGNIGPTRKSAMFDSITQGLNNFTNTYFANKELERLDKDPALKNAPLSEKFKQVQHSMARFGEYGEKMVQNAVQDYNLKTQEQAQEKILKEEKAMSRVIGKMNRGEEITDKDLENVGAKNQLAVSNYLQKKQNRKAKAQNIEEDLIKAGYKEDIAKTMKRQFETSDSLQSEAAVMKEVVDMLRRRPNKDYGKGQAQVPEVDKVHIDIPGSDQGGFDLEFPEEPKTPGMTIQDELKQNENNQKFNIPLYNDTVESTNSLHEDYKDFLQLEEYNNTPGALSTGGEKWNIDPESGELIFPALATPEEQDFSKILARLLGRAKEYFPGRVTNFDLAQFRKRFPGLSNSPEGRALILKQLKLANRVAFLKDEVLRAAYDKYGSGADPMFVRKIAQGNYLKIRDQLENQLKELDKQAEQMNQIKNAGNAALPGEIKVRFNGQEGFISRDKYEQAVIDGKGNEYELIE